MKEESKKNKKKQEQLAAQGMDAPPLKLRRRGIISCLSRLKKSML